MADAIELILEDHRAVEAMFEAFRAEPDRAIAERICQDLIVHTQVEEQLVYPRLRYLNGGGPLALQAEHDHGEMGRLVQQVEHATDDELGTRLDQLHDLVGRHVADEERDILTKVRDAVDAAQRESMGQQILQLKNELTSV
jgi:hemerythrin superfamily protein